MPLLNFKKQFAPKVESGAKRHTIRATRKVPIKVGDTLYLYTGLRTKNTRKLKEATCVLASKIEIYYSFSSMDVDIDNVKLSRNEIALLAINDGFDSERQFFDFFLHNGGLYFEGQLIKW